ncbi:MAG: hypothetical protein IT183_14080 [Acidobacteria bacterium]|nr:hypothetical protein [Acidobacteriota bacterium]
MLPAVMAGVILFGLAFIGTARALVPDTPPDVRDVDLYAAVAARVDAGESYYAVVAEEMPTRGYAVRPVFHWRLPTLAWLLAGLPLPVAHGLLWAIGALTIGVWARVLRLRVGAVGLVLIAPLWLLFSSTTIYMHELWAGQLIALALGLWMSGRTRAAVVAIVLAALVREHSMLGLGLLTIAAVREKRSPWLWGLAVAGVSTVYGAHAVAALQHTPEGGLSKGWTGLLGWPFAVAALRVHVLLIAAPYWVAALAAAVCVPALWLWREGRMVAGVVSAYLVVFCLGGRPDNWYWGLLILPLVPLGCIALARRLQSGDAA